MNDFWQALSDPGSTSTDVVQPRAPSRFEVETANDAAIAAPAPAPPAENATGSSRRPADVIVPDFLATIRPVEPPEPSTARTTLRPPDVAPAAGLSPQPGQARIEKPHQPAPTPPASAPTSLTATPSTEQGRVPVVPPVPAPQASSPAAVAPEPILQPKAERLLAILDNLPASQAEPASATTHRPASVVQPRLPVMQPDALPATPPGPTVRVTIGRIEVRAATPSSPPASPSPRPRFEPPMTLDAYLRRRNGDRR